MNPADTAWMMTATAMVMLMTPAGLALFYGGMTNRRSALNTIGMSYTAFCVATLAWVFMGYAIAFGEGGDEVAGGLEAMMFANIAPDDVEGTIPKTLFASFQGTFAAIAIAIVSGALVERVRYSTWIIFCVLWVIFCYAPLAHAVWGGGLLTGHGELDFAGGTVVHINAGVSGLVAAYMLGPRKTGKQSASPSSVKLMMLGSALLWFGWIGFNAGSALGANALAAHAVLVTNVAAAAGGMSWLLYETVIRKKSTLTGTASGVVSGLVGITPAAGYVDVGAAMFIGAFSGLAGYFAVIHVKKWLGYDDTLDAFGIHGLVGIVGAICTALFANPAISGEAGAFYGNVARIWPQLTAIGATIAFAAAVSFLCFKAACLLTSGGRISEDQEQHGADEAYHKESEDS